MGNFVTDLFSTGPADQAAKDKIAGFNKGAADVNADLTAGQTSADALYGKAAGNFSALGAKFGAGQDAYNDATGVNGADGIARAGSTFKSLPGYSGGLTTGIDQVNRNAAARGNLAGGNTSADEIKFASDYDANKYGSYLSSLAPNLSGATSATAGLSGVQGAQAGADLGVANTKASTAWNAATGAGNAQADADLAPYQASQNFWGALMGAGKLAVGAATGGASLAAGAAGSAIPGSWGATSYGGPNGPTPVKGGWGF